MNRNHEKRSNLKDEILTVAQSMFRDYGYDDTTFQKIADQLGITKGAITYHFKNKHLIMAHFFDRYFQTLRDFIDSYPDDYRNTYWRYCVMYIYAYRTIMKNPRNQSLFFHQDQMSLWESSKVPTVVEIYRAIAKDFHKTFTEEELLVSTYMDLGARRRLYREYVNNNQLLPIDKFCYYHIYLMGLLARLDLATVEENIGFAFAFANSHSPPTTPLLA